MTPQEKAKEIIDLMYQEPEHGLFIMNRNQAIKCAILYAIDIKAILIKFGDISNAYYYDKIQTELKKQLT